MMITMELGGTFPFLDDRFGNIKPVVRLTDIDLDGDLDAQIKLGITSGEKIWGALVDDLNLKVRNLLVATPDVETPVDILRKVQRQTEINAKNIERMAAHVKTLAPAVAAEAKKSKEPKNAQEGASS